MTEFIQLSFLFTAIILLPTFLEAWGSGNIWGAVALAFGIASALTSLFGRK